MDPEPVPEQGEQPPRQLVRHLRMPRRSTIILLTAFIATLLLYLAVQPTPKPTGPPIYEIVPATTTTERHVLVPTTVPRSTTTSTTTGAAPTSTSLPGTTTTLPSGSSSTATTLLPGGTTSSTQKSG